VGLLRGAGGVALNRVIPTLGKRVPASKSPTPPRTDWAIAAGDARRVRQRATAGPAIRARGGPWSGWATKPLPARTKVGGPRIAETGSSDSPRTWDPRYSRQLDVALTIRGRRIALQESIVAWPVGRRKNSWHSPRPRLDLPKLLHYFVIVEDYS
jgi:hypothetical protein